MADHRHKRDTHARLFSPSRVRATVVAGPVAFLATAAVVGVGVMGADVAGTSLLADAATSSVGDVATQAPDVAGLDRPQVLSRSSLRRGADTREADTETDSDSGLSRVERLMQPAAVRAAVRDADTRMWTTVALNLWDAPGEAATKMGELDAGKKVTLTGRSLYGRDEIVIGKRTRWVTSGYFSAEKPPTTPEGLSMEPCPDSSVESGLTDAAVYVYRSVCHAFPQITTYGGLDAHGEHSTGKAIDIMTSDPALLTQIGDYLRENAAELGIYDVIRLQHIWTPERGAEGWRLMPSRGSATADHYDHVHVAVY